MRNRGEALNALKRAIYTGRVGVQVKRVDEVQAVADALSLLANNMYSNVNRKINLINEVQIAPRAVAGSA